jgi:hypothetical protein
MNIKTVLSVVAGLILIQNLVSAQSKLVINDRAELIDEASESLLKVRLAGDSLDLTNIIDTRMRCDYWFVDLAGMGDDVVLTVTDCNEKVAGSKNLGSKIKTAKGEEKGLLIYFAISEITGDPYKNTSTPARTETEIQATGEPMVLDPAKHQSRYFFAPSAYNLEEGELYYNSLYFFLHDVQYGLSDQFSLGIGTTIAGLPFYITPKVTIPIDDKSAFAIGDMLMVGTWGTKFFGNLLYGTYSRGGAYNNVSVGAGYLYTDEGDITLKTNTPVFNFSALLQASDHIYFITENYVSQVKTRQYAYYNYYNPNNGDYIYYDESFKLNMFFIYGMSGFRFINRTRDVISWQFGLTYLLSAYGDIPLKYGGTNWTVNARSGSRLIAFPVIGYARKFSTRY